MIRVRSLMCAFLCLNGSLFAAADTVDAGDEYVMIGKIHEIFCQTAAQASEYGLSVEPVAAHKLIRDPAYCSEGGFELHEEHTVYTPRGSYILIEQMSGGTMAFVAFKQALLKAYNAVLKRVIRPGKKESFEKLFIDMDLAEYIKGLDAEERGKQLRRLRENSLKRISGEAMERAVGTGALIVSSRGGYVPVYEIKL